MDGILICGCILLIMLLRRLDQQEGVGAYAIVRHDMDDSTTDAICGSSLSLLNHSAFSSDDDWPTSSMMDDSPVADSYESETSTNTDWWTDPAYASLTGNIYHDTLIDPTHDDDSISSFNDSCSASLFDDSLSSSSGYDDSLSSSSFDDSWSSSSSDDSFSSCSSFDD